MYYCVQLEIPIDQPNIVSYLIDRPHTCVCGLNQVLDGSVVIRPFFPPWSSSTKTASPVQVEIYTSFYSLVCKACKTYSTTHCHRVYQLTSPSDWKLVHLVESMCTNYSIHMGVVFNIFNPDRPWWSAKSRLSSLWARRFGFLRSTEGDSAIDH